MCPRLVIFLLFSSCIFRVHAGLLRADGLVKTIGVGRSPVRLTVLPVFCAPYTVGHSGGRFDLELPYHAHYVLRAEAPGCATKEVIFNVNLPVRLNGEEREFPLEILMERMEEGASFHYAGPVGLVYFDEVKEAFVHTTDHRRIYENSPVLLAMHRAEGFADDGLWAAASDALAPPVGDPLAARLPHLSTGRSSTPLNGEDERGIRLVGERNAQPSVEAATGTAALPAPPIVQDAEPIRIPGEPMRDSAVIEPVQGVMEDDDVPRLVASATTSNAEPPEEGLVYVQHTSTSTNECGTTERTWVGRCLVTVDRLSTGSGCTEVRKAEHAYGAVFYFHDGRSITEHHYRQLLDGVAGN
ncbi:MAG: hypothetical protein ACO1NQ_13785 [Flavobacteriales bacterium]